MKVKVVRSCAGKYEEDGQLKSISAGMNDIIDLPEGVDWLRVGLVVPLKEAAETGALEPSENAMKPKPKRKRAPRSRAKKK